MIFFKTGENRYVRHWNVAETGSQGFNQISNRRQTRFSLHMFTTKIARLSGQKYLKSFVPIYTADVEIGKNLIRFSSSVIIKRYFSG